MKYYHLINVDAIGEMGEAIKLTKQLIEISGATNIFIAPNG